MNINKQTKNKQKHQLPSPDNKVTENNIFILMD